MAASHKPINEQVIVVTGASSGIGLATAREAAKRGAHLVLTARSGDALKEIVDEIVKNGGHAIAVSCDVAERAQVDHVVNATLEAFGRIDTWVNNAGVAIYGRLDEVSEADNRRLFDTNFWGVVNGSLAALPHLKRSGGALINVGSEVSDAYVPLLGMYVASKHAVKGFTDSLRLEAEQVDKSPVSITLIQPTATDTPFPQHARNYQDKEAKLPTPMIEPQRVAEAILDAAVNPTRAKRVGGKAVMNTVAAKFAPGVADKMAAKEIENLHFDERPRDPDGALYRASEASPQHVVGQVHGTGGREDE